MMDVTRGGEGEVVVRIDGAFDATAARRLRGWLVEIPRDDAVVLDFTHVRACDDFVLATFARELVARQHVVVQGLTRHHERMLRYFGVDLAALPGSRHTEDALG
jgi:anti-anti-sigma regulatory factor